MTRITISLPPSVEALARESVREGESFSATVARLIETGAKAERGVQHFRAAPPAPGYWKLVIDEHRYSRHTH